MPIHCMAPIHEVIWYRLAPIVVGESPFTQINRFYEKYCSYMKEELE